MKAFWLKSSLVAVLLLVVAAVGALPTRSDSEQRRKSFSSPSTQERRKGASTPLSYRSAGARHKLMIPNEDVELQQQLQAAGALRKVRKFKSYSLVEVDSATLDQIAPTALGRSQVRDDLNLLLLRRGQIDTSGPAPVVGSDLRQAASTGHSLHLVQLFGPPSPSALAAIKATGARIVNYVPNNAYLVWASAAQVNRLAAMRNSGDIVQWDGPFHPAYKLDPHFKLDSVAQTPISIAVLDTPDSAATIQRIKSVAGITLMPEFAANGVVHVKVLTEALNLKQLALLPDVIAVEPWSNPHLMDERANQIAAGQLSTQSVNNIQVTQPAAPGYLAFLNSIGFTSDFDFAIDIADTGFDVGSGTAGVMHPDFTNAAGQSRVAYINDYTQDPHPNPAHDTLGHGTINASIAAGFNNQTGAAFQDAGGYSYGLGAAPFARIGVSKIFSDSDDFGNVSFGELIGNAYRSGARISNNSWGACQMETGFCNFYGDDSITYDGLVRDADPSADGNQGMVILFASGNDGDNTDLAPSVAIPGTAKNVITVGVSENVRGAATETDGCGVGVKAADNAQDVVFFSSFGPVEDGRFKPDLVAPGTHITGAASQDPTYASANPNNLGVCDKYFPAGQTRYTWSSGTSHSTPLTAGAASLAFQWLRGQLGSEPSPALVKAFLLNSTSYLGGALANDNLPGAHQGWGLLDVGRMFEQTSRVLVDQSPDRTFTESGGQPYEVTGVISDSSKEFRVMLTYSDAPGSSITNAPYVNQLNLEVVVGGIVYEANNFSGQYSKVGGQLDFLNNTQGVRLPPGTTGPFVIRVKPTIIAGDGVPNFGGPLDQDFALVVTNGLEMPEPVLTVNSSGDLSAGVSVKHANNAVDSSLIPGETAAISLTVVNKSATTAATISSSGLTLTTGGHNVSVTAAAFSAIPAGGSTASSAPFNFPVPADLRCGSVVELQLALGMDAGTVKVPIRIQVGRASGAATRIIDDDVDSGRVKWKMKKGFSVVNSLAHSGTMSYHAVDPGKDQNDQQLAMLFTKKAFLIPSNAGGVRLSFFHIFNFEPGFDGGVMEASTDDGTTWQDLGSRILVGGYDGEVTATSSNPLGNRAAWTSRGRAGVFSQVIINLDDFAGQRVRFRFLAGFDAATGILDGYQGWFIDDIQITETPFACGAAATADQPASENFPRLLPRTPRDPRSQHPID